MSDISKIKIENDTYNIKDIAARSGIQNNTTLINKVANGTNRKYIFIGDSYNTNDTPAGGVAIVPWGPLTANYLGLSINDYYNTGVSGAAWVAGTTFLTQLQSLSSEITDKNSITDIIVCGGINDLHSSLSDVFHAIQDFNSYVSTNYPNARIHVGMISWVKDETGRSFLRTILQYYNAASGETKIRTIGNIHNAYHNYNDYQDDGHPTSSGSDSIALFLADYLKGGNPTKVLTYSLNVSGNQTGNSPITDTGTIGVIYNSLQDNVVYIKYTPSLSYLSSTASSISTDINYYIGNIGISSNQLFWFDNNVGNGSNIINSGIAYILDSDSHFTELPYDIHVNEKAVFLTFRGVTQSGNTVVSNPRKIYLYPFTNATFNTLNC